MKRAIRIDKTVSQIKRLDDSEDDYALLHESPARRLELVWEVSRSVWAMRGLTDTTPRLSRDVGRVIRPQR